MFKKYDDIERIKKRWVVPHLSRLYSHAVPSRALFWLRLRLHGLPQMSYFVPIVSAQILSVRKVESEASRVYVKVRQI